MVSKGAGIITENRGSEREKYQDTSNRTGRFSKFSSFSGTFLAHLSRRLTR